ncbi:MAG: thioredoxin domain-containing protein [Bacteroidota bacterium]
MNTIRMNRLAGEKSPYLLQHASNPVDWYPWGEEAFREARDKGKPILLSIGYSACHWCHVMEQESFDSPGTARIMNARFVNIKVDREERPDVDRVYMAALQAMGEGGGWPMTMFLTPDLRPFFGGTYFPPVARHGRIGFPELLERVAHAWEHDREKLLGSAGRLMGFLARPGPSGAGEPGEDVPPKCLEELSRQYDPVHGGFGGPPKFPRPSVFRFLITRHLLTRDSDALRMCRNTVRAILRGGIHDQIGGGFHRYSVDGEWRTPHFEKMLYDQAQMAEACLDLYLLDREPVWAEGARGALEYVREHLTSPDGGFYSSEDADSPRPGNPSERGEGAYYLWSRKEVDRILSAEDAGLFARTYGVTEEGNALADAHGEFAGLNILHLSRGEEGAPDGAARAIDRSIRILKARRSRRPSPFRDEKVLAAWNGLMIGAFARGFQVLGEPAYLQAACRAAAFVWANLFHPPDGPLLRRWHQGEPRHRGQLEDYAFLVQGFLDLYEASLDLGWLEKALVLTRLQTETFRDGERGGFFDSPGDDSSILIRTKDLHDGAEPCGNSVAAMNLVRLWRMTGKGEYLEGASGVFRGAAAVLEEMPSVLPLMCAALSLLGGPAFGVVITGRKGEAQTEALIAQVRHRHIPGRVLLLAEAGDERLERIAPFAAQLAASAGGPAAYLCDAGSCRLPVSDPVDLGKLLDAQPPGPGLP